MTDKTKTQLKGFLWGVLFCMVLGLAVCEIKYDGQVIKRSLITVILEELQTSHREVENR